MRTIHCLVGAALVVGGCANILGFEEGIPGAGGAGSGGSTTGTAGAAGSGGVIECTPGEPVSCYGGPAGTEDVGLCRAGSALCNDTGDGLEGPCEGEVLPVAENCSTADDENCREGACGAWSRSFGSSAADAATAVVATASGAVSFAGFIGGSVDFGGGLLDNDGGDDGLVAQLDGEGWHAFSVASGNAQHCHVVSMATDDGGNHVIAGYFQQSLDLGGPPLVALGINDGFVAKLDPSGGHLWSTAFGTVDDDRALSVAATSSGEVVVLGTTDGSFDLGSGTLTDTFVVRFDADGDYQWSERLSPSNDIETTEGLAPGIAVDDNAIWIAGSFDGTVDFGGGALVSSGVDIFVLKLGPLGAHAFSARYGAGGIDRARAVTLDESGRFAFTGSFKTSVSFGGSTFSAAGPGVEAFVAVLDDQAAHAFSASYGGTADDEGTAIAAVPGAGFIVGGKFASSAIDFGGPALTTPGLFLATLDASLGYVASSAFADGSLAATITGVASDGVATLLVGQFDAPIDLGHGPLANAGGTDMFAARLVP